MSSERAEYKICVKGHLDERWVSWFEGLTMTNGFSADGTPITMLSGSIADQAALHGVLSRIRDIGIPIISINWVTPEKGAEDEK